MAPPREPPPAAPGRSRRRKLGELLLEEGHLTWPQLETALTLQRQWGTPLGRVAVARGYCTDAQLLAALSKQLGLQVVDLDTREVDQRAAELLRLADAERLRAVPFAFGGSRDEELQVAFAAPAPLDVQDAVLALAGKARVRTFLCGDDVLERAIGRIYRHERHQAPPAWPRAPLELDPEPESGPVPLELSSGTRPMAPEVPRAPAEPTTDPEAPAAAPPPEPATAIEALQLSEACVRVIRKAAADNQVTPREVMRRVLEAWAEPYGK